MWWISNKSLFGGLLTDYLAWLGSNFSSDKGQFWGNAFYCIAQGRTLKLIWHEMSPLLWPLMFRIQQSGSCKGMISLYFRYFLWTSFTGMDLHFFTMYTLQTDGMFGIKLHVKSAAMTLCFKSTSFWLNVIQRASYTLRVGVYRNKTIHSGRLCQRKLFDWNYPH